ncbi:MAG: hypothetical protein ABIN67_18265, partial [Ferruginibacter sp.]
MPPNYKKITFIKRFYVKILLILTLSLILTSSANSQQMTDAETNALQLANDGKIAEAIQGFEK